MQINSRHFGVLEIDERGIIEFPEGLPGFEDVRKFAILGTADDESPFQWLHGVDDPDIAFVVIEPKHFMPDYDIDVDDKEVQALEIKDVCKVLIYNIVVIPDDMTKMTANLKAPVLINTEARKGKQVILDRGGYETKHYIIEELKKMGGLRHASSYQEEGTVNYYR